MTDLPKATWRPLSIVPAVSEPASEIVERVASVLRNFRPVGGDGPLTDEVWREAARAAIEAMREPTVEMLVAAYDVVGVPKQPVLANGYRAMIDAALKP